MKIKRTWQATWTIGAALALCAMAGPLYAQRHHREAEAQKQNFSWMNKSLSPDERAALVLKEMTLDEKIDLLHGNGMRGWEGKPNPNAYLSNGGAGFVLGVPRLGIPTIQMSDAAYGVRSSAENGRYSTALPSDLAAAASWDPHAACEYGALIGTELRAQGYNMTLGGGVDLVRELRNGRNFEYMGEDPVLAGTMVGNRIKCEEAQHVIGDTKHYAMNDQESGRTEMNAIIGKRAMQESDLLAFQIGVKIGQPGAVMCAYNGVNGDYACENKYLLTDVLRGQWHFEGFVVSDWGGTHSTEKASAAGLDNEQPLDLFYGEKFKEAVQSGKISAPELDEHVRRILRTEFATGIIDYPRQPFMVNADHGFHVSRQIEEASAVLLRNESSVLPLDAANLHSIAVIGDHADMGVLSGAGSAQVDAEGGYPPKWQEHVWFPTSPLKAIRKHAPNAQVEFNSGADPAAAAELAKKSDIAIVFVNQWESEGMDLPSLSLPDNQDALIERVAAANPKTIVVLETGSAALMPWIDKVSGVLEAWYPGNRGAQAIANILFGEVNPSAKLPITFPASESDQPPPGIVPPPPGKRESQKLKAPIFDVKYTAGFDVGYKWYDAEHKRVLFPFGYGLSYTTYDYSDLKVDASGTMASFTLKNTGSRAGEEIAEVYAGLPASAGEPPKRLVGWAKVPLKAGESKEVSVKIDRLYLKIYDDASDSWKLAPGSYEFMVGGSSKSLPLKQQVSLQ
ncbi:MAG TPA: glycoside hydrolase family 3 C-terminal domain-containing protein [Candidatus Acidoferrales bacterium]|nr:glycoside hydrolase family 3 C-terminal domain-containing protein [Candidatus Acidoferrales bacterium]